MIRASHLGAIAERPQVVKKQERKVEPANLIVCANPNCGQKKPLANLGMCNGCYRYQWKHGKPRPRSHVEREKEKRERARWCKTCGQPEIHAIGECVACYSFRRKNGKSRPRFMWDVDFCCAVCGCPEKAGLSEFQGDKCSACDQYQRKYGKPRPAKLWGNGEFGWCDCGYPAEHQIDKINMCNRCVKEYR